MSSSTPPPPSDPSQPQQPQQPLQPQAPVGGATPPPPPPPAQQYGAPAPQGGFSPAFGAPAAGVPRPGELIDRFVARLIDFVILGVVYGILYAIFSSIFLRGFSYSVGEYLLFYLFLSVITTAIYVGYFAFLESSRGQTIGKQVMKLKVFGPDGATNPTMEQGVRRNIWLALGLIAIVPILGWFLAPLAQIAAMIMIAVGINSDTARRQAWHDNFAGGTQVMKIG